VQFLTLPNLSNCNNICAYGTPAYYNNTIYMNVVAGPILALPLTNGLFEFNGSNVATASSVSSESYAFPGPTVSVSAAPGGGAGILWVLDDSANGPSSPLGPSILRAYSSSSLATTLYSSSAKASDTSGNAIKFMPPVIANGHVYVGGARQLTVYGLLN
jgi:hypothetical protein